MNDHDASMCPNVPCDECDGYEVEHVNYVNDHECEPRIDVHRNVGNRNYHNHVNYDNYNQSGGCRNHGVQGIHGSYNNHGYNKQSHGRGHGDHNQSYGNHSQQSGQNQARGNWNNQSRGYFQANFQRGSPIGLVPNTQGLSDDSYDQPFSFRNFLEEIIEKQAKILETYMALNDEKFNHMLTYNKDLGDKLSQLANVFKEFADSSSLTSPILNSKNPMDAIVTRSGRVLEGGVPKKSDASESTSKSPIEIEGDECPLSEKVDEEQVERVKEKEKELYKPKLPYPQGYNRHKLDEQFREFVEMLKKLHLTLPFTDVVEQMPNYAKFLKEILSGKRTCDMMETISLPEHCSAIIMNKMPPKLKDPGNFSIPCSINKTQIDNALYDLGASVSLMPYSVYQRLGLGEILPSKITLQLADRSIKIPKGKVEDVPLRVGKFIIPVDFVVLDMDEGATTPIILGRPFLATSGAMFDVKSAKISLKIGEEVVEFDLNEGMKYPSSSFENFIRIEVLDNIVQSMHEHLLTSNDPLECVLLNKEKIGIPNKEVQLYEDLLDRVNEGSDDQICMGISSQDALHVASTKEGKGVPMVELKPLP
ncbi:uncharacterized protein LOC110688909 [Chenopodium quinoa]|uniref:uncharacterized protein LOC110688909 n=1 Tax=Chenopodium quinoa TaxID=63459 RepID=UPI000B787F23|nr:uncharacterized protein LOC110688909 [Chenopodium quinoa]